MSKKVIVSILCALAMMLAFTGCKKDNKASNEANAAKVEAPAADAAKAEAPAADAAKADAPAADAAKADAPAGIKAAAKDAAEFMLGLSNAAKNAGDDCKKLGEDMSKYLGDNKDKFAAAMKTLSTIKEDSPEAEQVKDELSKVEAAMGDESEFKKSLDKCSETPEVQAFSLAFLAVMMAAANDAEEADPEADAE